MSKRRRVVRFVMPSNGNGAQPPQIKLGPERALQTANIGVWVGLATILWSLIVIPTFVI